MKRNIERDFNDLKKNDRKGPKMCIIVFFVSPICIFL